MKLDKDTLLKHKFWILLLVALILSVTAIGIDLGPVAGENTRKRTEIEGEIKKFSMKMEIKTPAEIAAARAEANNEKAKEKTVWESAYNKQDGAFLWPDQVEREFDFRSGLFAQNIKVKMGADEASAEAPKDEDRLIHGKVIEVQKNYIVVEGNDKRKHRFFRSMNVVSNPVEGDEKLKEVDFARIPIGSRVAVKFHRGKYFNEDLTDSEQNSYTGLGVYLSQIEPLIAQVEPMNDRGEGVVQLKGWFYKRGELPPGKAQQKFLNYLDQGWVAVAHNISEEAWMAQEDIWIQQELYRLIRLANDYVSKFEGTGGEDKTKVYTFKNPFLELGVQWAGGTKLTLKMKNLQNRRQTLDISLRIRFHKTLDQAETIVVGGLEPLGPRGTKEAEATVTIPLKGENTLRKGIYGVDQVLTWETAAVKRIDQITIGSLGADEGSLGHRLFPEGQKPLKPPPPEKAKDFGNDPPPMGGIPGGRGPLGGLGAAGGNELTRNGLIKNRYLDVTPQSRRIPVALVLIVDQEHIDRVLTAFNNSRLRFLTTQVLLNRYPASLRPQLASDNDPAAGAQGPLPPPVVPRQGGRDPNQPGIGPRPPGPMGGFGGFGQGFGAGGAGLGGVPPTTGASELETNIELVLYGIMTLYERFPPPLITAPAPEPK